MTPKKQPAHLNGRQRASSGQAKRRQALDYQPVTFVKFAGALGLTFTVSCSGVYAADESTFADNCGKCHGRPHTLVRSLKGTSLEERSAVLSKFLETHHADDPAVRTAIVNYLVGLSAP